jgi:hypothetical protein
VPTLRNNPFQAGVAIMKVEMLELSHRASTQCEEKNMKVVGFVVVVLLFIYAGLMVAFPNGW